MTGQDYRQDMGAAFIPELDYVLAAHKHDGREFPISGDQTTRDVDRLNRLVAGWQADRQRQQAHIRQVGA